MGVICNYDSETVNKSIKYLDKVPNLKIINCRGIKDMKRVNGTIV